MNGALGFAFAAGAVATVNPCGFALLPAYLARQVAEGGRTGSAAAAGRALAVGALATVGFLLVFASAGSAIALGAHTLTGIFPWLGLAVGLLLAAFGLATLLGRQPSLRLPQLGRRGQTGRPGGDVLFGIGYGLASLSCALPLFLATLGTASTGSLLTSALSFVAYALGMGTVLTLVALAAALSRGGLARALRRLLPYIGRASGALLLVAGLYVSDYWAVDLWRPGSGSAATAPVTAGGRLATSISTWLASTATKTGLLVAAGCLLLAALWQLRRRAAGHPFARRAGTTRADRPLPRRNVPRRLLTLAAVMALIFAAGASAFALIGTGSAARPLDRSALRGFVDPAAAAPPFALRDQFGRLVRLSALRGRPVLIAFVYSHCRDACPLTAAKIRAAQQALGPAASKLAWLAISVDPRTDTGPSVRAFSRRVGLLHSWSYLFQPQEAVSRALKAYGIQAQLTEASATADPYRQHSAYVALLDANGRRIESFTDASLTTTDLVHDLRLITGEQPTRPTSTTQPATASKPSTPAGSFAPSTPQLALTHGVLSLSGTDLVSGRPISLDADAGKPVVLNAWASWCAGCAAEAPALAGFARAHPEAAVVGIDLEDTRSAAIAFSRRFALPFPSIFDPNAVSAVRLEVSGLPTTIFLDRQHRVVSRIVGEADRARFETGLRQAERP
ncbi:MAG: SCO family protein [Solirubrobacteraceae bacterium]